MKMDMARGLITLGAVKLSPLKPFTYASGLKGPIYCDNRISLSHVEFRNKVVSGFISTLTSKHLAWDAFGGIATAGIPYASFVADRLGAPMIYIRPKPKGHGKMNQVEGDAKPGQKIIMFEDLVNQGSSLVDAYQGLVNAELQCTDCLCVVDYQMQASQTRLAEHKIQLHSLTDFTSLSLAALELKLINQEELALLKKWQTDPNNWSDSL